MGNGRNPWDPPPVFDDDTVGVVKDDKPQPTRLQRIQKNLPAYAKLAHYESIEVRKILRLLENAFINIEAGTRTGYPDMARKVLMMRNLEDAMVLTVKSFLAISYLLEIQEPVSTTELRFMKRVHDLDPDVFDAETLPLGAVPSIADYLKRRRKP